MTHPGTHAQSIAEDDQPTGRRRSRRAMHAAAAVLAIGLIISGISAILWMRADQATDRKDFHSTAKDVTATAGILLQRDADFVSTLRTLLTMHPDLTPTEFAQWYRRLEGNQRQVGGLGSAVVRVVAAKDLIRFQQRRDTDPAFIRYLGSHLTFVAPTGQPQYCLLGASGIRQPLTSIAAQLVQQDWCNPRTYVGSTEATALWAAGAADRVLVNPINVAWLRTTLFEVPFYRRGAALGSPAERTASTLGWIVGSFDVSRLLAQALGHKHGLNVRLQYANTDGKVVEVASLGHAAGALTRRTAMDIDGRWTITVTGATVVSGVSPALQGAIISGAVVVMTLLLSLLILTLSRSRERALAMVAEKTGQLRHQALHDALTGLPNRVLAIDRADQMLARSRRADQPIAVLYIDIDGFKHINDTFGHAVGDMFLKAVAARAGDGGARR